MEDIAAQAALLDTAKRCCGVGNESPVEGHHAAFDAFGDPQSTAEVLGKDVGCEAVL